MQGSALPPTAQVIHLLAEPSPSIAASSHANCRFSRRRAVRDHPSHAAQARPDPARMRDVPRRERRCVRPRGCRADGGAAPDAPAMRPGAAHAQPADRADGGRVDGADAGGGRLLLLGEAGARPVRGFRRGLPDNFIHRRRHGDLSGTFRQLSFVHPADRPGGAGRYRRRARLARRRSELSRHQAGRDGVSSCSLPSSSRRSRYW